MIDIIYRFDANYRRDRPAPQTPDEARIRLEDGNRLFAELLEAEDKGEPHEPRIIPFDLRDMGFGEAAGFAPLQMPFAAVLGCADARVPTEIVFSQGCNDLFVVRVAGNILGGDCLGSFDYAVRNLKESLKLLVVLAHSNCGAVTAAVNAFLNPAQYLAIAGDYSLRSLVDRLMVSIRAAAEGIETVWGHEIVRHPQFQAALIDVGVVQNAALNAYALNCEAREHEDAECEVVFGIYDLLHRRVGVPISKSGNGWNWHLSPPPANEREFAELAERVAVAPHVRTLLESSGQE